MFTGIIVGCARVLSMQAVQSGARMALALPFVGIQVGESIAIDGVCLTVTELGNAQQEGSVYFDLSPETLHLTTLGLLRPGSQVNIERALRLCDRLGGHFVSGHVDQIASVATLSSKADFVCMRFMGINQQAIGNVLKKGSIAVNGVSLTVNDLFKQDDDHYGFEVMLIPQTLQETNFSELKVDDKVNIEFDMLIKVINNRFIYEMSNRSGGYAE